MKYLMMAFIAAMLSAGNVMALDADRLSQSLESDDRPESDKQRDPMRRPVEVLQFLGVEEGMTVLDIMASSGWYTEVLSRAVGDSGQVLMQNSPDALNSRGTEEAVQERLANNRLSNVQRVDRDFDNLGIAPNSVDFAITALNFHDLYNNDPAAAQQMLSAVHEVLKPGGVMGVIDHKGDIGANNADLHRIPIEYAIQSITDANFVITDLSTVLNNPEDDHTMTPFADALERNTDRFLLKLRPDSAM